MNTSPEVLPADWRLPTRGGELVKRDLGQRWRDVGMLVMGVVLWHKSRILVSVRMFQLRKTDSPRERFHASICLLFLRKNSIISYV